MSVNFCCIAKCIYIHTHTFFFSHSSEGANNETDLCSLTDTKFKKEIVKILKELRVNMKELRADMNSNADYFRKEPDNTRSSQKKLENSLVQMQTELKSLNSRMYNAEE